MKRKVGALFLNGEFCRDTEVLPFDICVACDGGYQNAISLGVSPSVLVGDMDSISEMPSGVETFTYPAEKNFTDGEAGLCYLVDNGCEEIHIYCGLGGRLSHTICNLHMASGFADRADITFYGMEEKVYLKNKSFEMREKVGKTISLAPISGEVHILKSKGLKYPLENLTLKTTNARGVSNVAVEKVQSLEFSSGVIMVAVWEGL